jgi:D-3-phosphoglycerate dehydrogenase
MHSGHQENHMNNFRVLLTTTSFQDTPGEHHTMLEKSGNEIVFERGPLSEKRMLELAGNFDAFLCGDDEITKDVIEKSLPRLRVISKYGIGIDKIDVKTATKVGIPVLFTPGVNHQTVAEHTFSLLLGIEKNLINAVNTTRSGNWNREIGHEVFGKTLGIIGLGRIGKELAKRANAFGMQVVAFDKYWDGVFAEEHKIKRAETLDELSATSDYVTLHAPATEENFHMINKGAIAKMKDGVIILNTARGDLIDEDAMIAALKTRKVRYYGADVLQKEPPEQDHPLLHAPNVLITPHIGSRTYESVVRQAIASLQNLHLALNGEEPIAQTNPGVSIRSAGAKTVFFDLDEVIYTGNVDKVARKGFALFHKFLKSKNGTSLNNSDSEKTDFSDIDVTQSERDKYSQEFDDHAKHGVSARDHVIRAVNNTGYDPNDKAQYKIAMALYQNTCLHYVQEDIKKTENERDIQMLPGVYDRLQSLKPQTERGLYIYFPTNGPAKGAEAILRSNGLGNMIDKGQLMGQPWPDGATEKSHLIAPIIEKLNCHPKQVILFDDTPRNVRDGKSIGITVIGVAKPHKTQEEQEKLIKELKAAGADAVITDWQARETSEIFRSFGFQPPSRAIDNTLQSCALPERQTAEIVQSPVLATENTPLLGTTAQQPQNIEQSAAIATESTPSLGTTALKGLKYTGDALSHASAAITTYLTLRGSFAAFASASFGLGAYGATKAVDQKIKTREQRRTQDDQDDVERGLRPSAHIQNQQRPSADRLVRGAQNGREGSANLTCTQIAHTY